MSHTDDQAKVDDDLLLEIISGLNLRQPQPTAPQQQPPQDDEVTKSFERLTQLVQNLWIAKVHYQRAYEEILQSEARRDMPKYGLIPLQQLLTKHSERVLEHFSVVTVRALAMKTACFDTEEQYRQFLLAGKPFDVIAFIKAASKIKQQQEDDNSEPPPLLEDLD